ncbi:helix-turn-helix domain-containing protein [Streptomyces sp. NPDC086091]|uniref:helix-turn-helix domain-containing protein n=1 Tax=Streptomyces sp. NPDC086091 TaxID=3365751 RepID=UPI003807C0EC
MTESGRPSVHRRRLGAALKRYRMAADLDQPQVAEVIAAHPTRVSRIETGHVVARPIEIRAMLKAYGIADLAVRDKLEALAKRTAGRGWWSEYAAYLRPDFLDHLMLEDDATRMGQWQPVLVPGLLQTRAYAEAVIAGGPATLEPEHVAALVEVRRRRQDRLAERGARYDVVVWEATIMHPLTTVETHRDQLAAILEFGARENITVQVLPFSAGALVAASSGFTSFSFDSEELVEAVTMDDLMSTPVLDSPQDLAVYTRAFDLLRAAALSHEESMKLVNETLKSLDEE